MGVYDRPIATVKRLIAAKGELVGWTIAASPVASDVTKPWITTDSVPTVVPTSILFTVDKTLAFLTLMAGSVIESSGQKGLMGAGSFVPKADDTVLRSDGVTRLSISSVTPLAPNGEIIMYFLVFKA